MQVVHYMFRKINVNIHKNIEINYDDPLTELEYIKLKKKLEKEHGYVVVICNIMTFPK